MEQVIGWFAFAGIFLIMSVCFLLTTIYLKKTERYFRENSREVSAVLVGFKLIGSNRSPVVEFTDEQGEKIKTVAHADRKIYGNCNIGENVKVSYLFRKSMGIEVYDVRFTEGRYAVPDSRFAVYMIRVLWIALAMAALVFFVMGMKAYFKMI